MHPVTATKSTAIKALCALCAIAGLMMTGSAFAQTTITGNCNAVGNNNVIVCNFGPQRLQFTPAVADKLLSLMPEKKKVVLKVIGNTRDQNIGNQIQSFLVKNSYPVERWIIGQMSPPPDDPLTLHISATEYLLTVAPSAF